MRNNSKDQSSQARDKKYSRSLVVDDTYKPDLRQAQDDLEAPLVHVEVESAQQNLCYICDKPDSLHK